MSTARTAERRAAIVIIVCVLVLLAPMFRAAPGSASARRAAIQAASAPQAALYSATTGRFNTLPGYKARYGAGGVKP
jgi:flagellar basal body-associated protein FliL